MEFKVDPTLLKEETLKIIDEHNAIEWNRKVTPIDWYGNMDTAMSPFWALRSDDDLSSSYVWFTYKWEKLIKFWGKEEILTMEEALTSLKRQLEDIK